MGIFSRRREPATTQLFLAPLDRLQPAGVDLEAKAGFWPTGCAGICAKDAPGVADALEAAVASLSELEGASPARCTTDAFGYRWLLLRGEDLGSAATQVHLVLNQLAEGGLAASVACAPFSFQAAERGPLYLVFLPARGGFYPFAPTGSNGRDNQLELTIAAELGEVLDIEGALERWFPIYDCPVEAPA